jgi:NAD(P)-dependent dehydrogenase (short-subunit alcohol dehydrogenase family)
MSKERGNSPLGFILVTGASTGIGEATAIHLAGLGFHVFAGVRQTTAGERLQAAAPCGITPVILDVTDGESIGAARKDIERSLEGKGLMGLVNNAGIAVGGPLEFLDLNEMRQQLEVNVIGPLAVIQAFLPLIRKAQGRIVNIGSMSGRVACPLLGSYCASKYALEALTASLRQELRPWSIQVSLIGPGKIVTPLWKKSMIAAEERVAKLPQEAHERYGQIMTGMLEYSVKEGKSGLPPLAVARTVEHALTAAKPRTRYTVGADARGWELLRILPERLRENLVAREIRKHLKRQE